MFGPLCDLRAPLLQGLQLNYESPVRAKSQAPVSGNKEKQRQGPGESVTSNLCAENVATLSCDEAGKDFYPSAAEGDRSHNQAGESLPEESASCKRTCPHYHGNAPPPRPRGKAVCRTIQEITQEAYTPRQHVLCQDPACPRPDSYCRLCCPNFSCRHVNDTPCRTDAAAQPDSASARHSPDGPGLGSRKSSNHHLSGSSRLHDQLYKGKGVDVETHSDLDSLIAQHNARPLRHSQAARQREPSASSGAMRGKATATVGFGPSPHHAPPPASSNTQRLAATDQGALEGSYQLIAGERGDGYEADDDASESDELRLDVSLRTVIKLATAFFFIYSAMNSLSEYVTSLLPDALGDESLFVIQTVLCASSLAAPTIVTAVGELRAMVLGGLTHVVYLLVLMFPSRMAVLLSSAFCGFGASLVWVAQGAFLTKCSPHSKRGLFAGVFWGIYYLADIVGNLAAYLVFRFSSQSALFGLGAASACFGVLLLFLMEEQHHMHVGGLTTHTTAVSRGSRSSMTSASTSNSTSRSGPSRQISRIYRNWLLAVGFLLLTPITVYIGFESAFWTGEFTKLFPSTSIGVVLLCTGIGQVLGAFVLSWLSDYFRYSSPTFLIGVVASVGALLICIPLKNEIEQGIPLPGPYFLDAPAIAYLGGFCFGIADGVITSHMFAMIGRLFPGGRKPEIWAVFNLLGNGGAAVTYWLGILYPLSRPGGFGKQIASQLIMLCIGTPLYVIVDIGASFLSRFRVTTLS